MQLISISNQVPPTQITYGECWDILQKTPEFHGLKKRSQKILQQVLLGDAGIDKRHIAITPPEKLFSHSAEELNHLFEKHATELATKSLLEAMEKGAVSPDEIDALIVCTCTGYICPGLSSHIAEKCGLKTDTVLQDLVGLGCGAAIPTLRNASWFLQANPKAKVAVIAVEICTAAFYLNNDIGMLISLCLFSDGCSASIWSGEEGGLCSLSNFKSLHYPEDREKIRFINEGGKLVNKLHKTVPELAANSVKEITESYHLEDFHLLTHSGGRNVLDAIQRKLPEQSLIESRKVLKNYANMSSPSVLFALEEFLLQNKNTPNHTLLTAFGAGFACHSCKLERASPLYLT